MILTLIYQSGEKRVINLHPSFFTSDVIMIFNKRSNHSEKKIITPAEKGLSLARSLASNLYSIHLERHGQVQFSTVFGENKPIVKDKLEPNNKDLVKEFKKETKGLKLKTYFKGSY